MTCDQIHSSPIRLIHVPSPFSLTPLSVVYHPVLICSNSPFFFFCRGCIRGWTGRFYERGVYVSMWVFVTLHLNPHHSFVCFFGLFIVRTLPFSCSSFLQRPSVPTPDYPQQSRTWRLMKTGVATYHSNSLPMKLNAFFMDHSTAEDKTICRNVGYQSTSDTTPHPR